MEGKVMYHNEQAIAQAEHKAYVAQLAHPEAEGYTVYVPNAIDCMVAALRHLLTAHPPQPTQRKAAHAMDIFAF